MTFSGGCEGPGERKTSSVLLKFVPVPLQGQRKGGDIFTFLGSFQELTHISHLFLHRKNMEINVLGMCTLI